VAGEKKMSTKNKVIWTEGMFLKPQHFQQHDRYIEGLINDRCLGLGAYDRGFYSLKIDTNLLKIGKFGLTACRGIFPDGTPFNLPEDNDLPQPLDVPEDTRNEIVFLAIPLRRPGATETENPENADRLARFRSDERDVRDNNCGSEDQTALQIGKLNVRLLRQSDERSGYAALGTARIVEVGTDRNLVIDDKFIPTTLNCAAISHLHGYLRELHGMLNTRGEAVGGRVATAGQSGVAEIADFLLLQLVNRYQVLFGHYINRSGLHPEVFYRTAIQLAGELATFFRPDKRPAPLPAYDHDDLQTPFSALMETLRELLGKVHEPNAIQIPLSKPKFGVYAAKRPDISLLNNAVFVLAASAQISPETLRGLFPQQVKIGPVEEIQRLVNSALPGIGIQPLSVAPRQIPFHVGYTYFELNKRGPLWEKMATSGGFAVHVGGSFPELKLEFWAIRKG
jgi:type VI secretion system protein ImpJ